MLIRPKSCGEAHVSAESVGVARPGRNKFATCGGKAIEEMQHALAEVFANAKCLRSAVLRARQATSALKDRLADEFDSPQCS